MSTYVISDLHGQYRIFLNLLEKAGFSDEDKLYMLGDAVDRGSDSMKILHHVMRAPNMDFLLGNHEMMMLSTVPKDGSAPACYQKLPEAQMGRWIIRNGGNKTYYKYKLLKREERLELLEWLNSRPLLTTVKAGGTTYLLTHSYFDLDKLNVPFRDWSYQEAWDILWKSPYRPDLHVDPAEYEALTPMKVVLGHVPVYHADKSGKKLLQPLFEGNIIDIDGCCAHHSKKDRSRKGGILLRLDDLTSFTCSFEELDL